MDELAGCLLGMFPQKVQTAAILLLIFGFFIFIGVAIYREVSAEPSAEAPAKPSAADSW